MKKKFKLILIFLLGVVAIFFQAAPTYGRYYFFEKTLAVDGYIQNQSSLRLGGAGLVSFENMFRIDADYKFSRNLSFYGSWRDIYDAVWDIRHDHGEFWDNNYGGSRDRLQNEDRLREMYGVLVVNKLTLKLGLQQIVWGEAVGLRLMDVINPLDMRRQFNVRDYADTRRGLTALRATYDIDPVRNWFAEFVWVPDFKKDLLDVSDPNPMFGTRNINGPWSIPLPPASFTPWGAPVIPVITQHKPTRYSFNSSNYGGRMGIELGGFFITLNYFHFFNHNPSTEFHGSTPLWFGPGGPSPIPGAGPPDLILLDLQQRFLRTNMVGGTFNKPLGDGNFVLMGEFALYPDEPMGSLDTSKHPDMVARKARLHAMIAFDYKRWIKWLNPDQMISFNGQVFEFWTIHHEWGLVEGPYNQKLPQSWTAVSVKANTDYCNGRVSPECVVLYDVTHSGWEFMPKVTFKYGDHWRPAIGAVIFQGSGLKLPFNVMNRKDEFYVQIKYLF